MCLYKKSDFKMVIKDSAEQNQLIESAAQIENGLCTCWHLIRLIFGVQSWC